MQPKRVFIRSYVQLVNYFLILKNERISKESHECSSKQMEMFVWNLNDYLPKKLIKQSIDNAHIPNYMWPKKSFTITHLQVANSHFRSKTDQKLFNCKGTIDATQSKQKSLFAFKNYTLFISIYSMKYSGKLSSSHKFVRKHSIGMHPKWRIMIEKLWFIILVNGQTMCK